MFVRISFQTIEPFITKLGMAIHHQQPEGCAKRIAIFKVRDMVMTGMICFDYFISSEFLISEQFKL